MAGSLWQLVLLAAGAGCCDALSLTTAGVFTANMTGNTVVLAIACVHGNSPRSLLAGTALVAYLAGVSAGARVGRRRPDAVLVALMASTLAFAAVRLWLPTPASSLAWRALPIVVAALAMGLQSAWLCAVGVSGVSTTYMSGTLTALTFDFAATALHSVDRARGLVLAAFFAGALAAAAIAVRHDAAAGALPVVLVLAVAVGSLTRRRARCRRR